MNAEITRETPLHGKESCLIGAHFSIAGGLENALTAARNYGCRALQIFTKNANTWRERTLTPREIDRFKKCRLETGLDAIASHTSYLINLATPDPKKHEKSCAALVQELTRSAVLALPYVVLHPGSHMGEGEAAGQARIIESINRVFRETHDMPGRLLLETTAGQGDSLGHTFEQLAFILERVEDCDRVGVCLDTCHIFAAGYDIRTKDAYRHTMDRFDSAIGMDNLYLIHLNDSLKDLGSRVDRHAHIGRGHIGPRAFELIMNDPGLLGIPKIIETPKEKGGPDWDEINLRLLAQLCDQRKKGDNR